MAEVRPPEFEPPATCVVRIIKSVLPDNIMVTKDAKQAFVRAAGIFIFYLTHCSNDFCKDSKRQTIFPQDVINALKELGFDDFEEPLIDFLERHKKEADKKKKSKVKSGDNPGNGGEAEGDHEDGEDEAEAEGAAADNGDDNNEDEMEEE